MAWRFRRSVRIAPGVRMNFGKSGFTSWSFGGRGYRTTVSSRGVRRSFGIPGTGLSHSTFSPRQQTTDRSFVQIAAPVEAMADRFGLKRSTAPMSAGAARLMLFVVGGSALVVGSLAGVGAVQVLGLALVAVAFLLRSKVSVQRKLDATHAEAVAAELERRRAQFEAAAAAAGADAKAIRDVIELKNRLELTDAEVGSETIDELAAEAAVLELNAAIDANGGNLPRVAGQERIVGNEVCYMVATNVLYDKRGDDDPTGALYLTQEQAFFVAPTLTHKTPWSKVISIVRDGRVLRVQRRDRQTPTEFWFDSRSDAAIGAHIATRLWSK